MALLEEADTFDTRHSGQADVHQDDVGERGADTCEGVLHRTKGRRAAVALGAVDQRGEPIADLAPILDHGNLDHRHRNLLTQAVP